jgi:hypothetical protein
MVSGAGCQKWRCQDDEPDEVENYQNPHYVVIF